MLGSTLHIISNNWKKRHSPGEPTLGRKTAKWIPAEDPGRVLTGVALDPCVLSVRCKGSVGINCHSSCQPLRLGLVWIAIEFELISFSGKTLWLAQPTYRMLDLLLKCKQKKSLLWFKFCNEIFCCHQEYFVDGQNFAFNHRSCDSGKFALSTLHNDNWYAHFAPAHLGSQCSL